MIILLNHIEINCFIDIFIIFFSQTARVDIFVVRYALLVSICELFAFYLLRSLLAWKIVTTNELEIQIPICKGAIVFKHACSHSWSIIIQKQLLGPRRLLVNSNLTHEKFSIA